MLRITRLLRSALPGAASCASRASSHGARATPAPAPLSPRLAPLVAVGLSGGVDSAVTALLLSSAGFRVLGVFMRNWDAGNELAGASQPCTSADDLASARAVARTLRIPLHEVDFVPHYWSAVFAPFLESYARGATPNPDVACNRRVKFGAFREHCLSHLGADLVAFGHYAQVWPPALQHCPLEAHAHAAVRDLAAGVAGAPAARARAVVAADWQLAAAHADGDAAPPPALLAAADRSKDQSDFLCRVPGAALRRVLLPLGALHKADVRRLAAAARLPNAGRRDSVGICFVGKRELRDFIGGYLALSPARLRAIDSGAVLARSDAAEAWTVGQRARIAGVPQPHFVAGLELQPPPAAAAAERLSALAALHGVAGAAASAVVPPLVGQRGGLRRGRGGDHENAALQDGTAAAAAAAVGGGAAAARAAISVDPPPAATVWVAAGHAHPALLADAAVVQLADVNWLSGEAAPPEGLSVGVTHLPAALHPLLAHALARRHAATLAPGRHHPLETPPAAAPTAAAAAAAHLGEPPALRSWLQLPQLQLAQPGAGGDSSDSRSRSRSSAAPRLPVRYRIRHRQTDFQRAQLLLLWEDEWRSALGAALLRVRRRLPADAASDAALLRGLPAEAQSALVAAAAAAAERGGDGASALLPTLPLLPATQPPPPQLLLVALFQRPQRAVAPGQELVLYDDAASPKPPPPPPLPPLDSATAAASAASRAAADEAPWADAGRLLLGGGPVAAAGPSLHHLALGLTDAEAAPLDFVE